jgi:uncharacterized protein YbgA (DUF1722 family)/uncharacterized protein YbbK (DUF523 family)
MSEISSAPIRVGISACLLGQEVRYNGGHKRDDFLVETLGRYVEWVPVCPEVEMGLGTPRNTLRLVRIGHEVHLTMPKTGEDHSAAMQSYSAQRLRELAKEDLCGYVLKKDSPSCGKERVRVFDVRGIPVKSGRGVFADVLLQHFPHLPVEEEHRLCDLRLRENFIERVFAYARLRALFSGPWKISGLISFHAAHKLLLMAHSPKAYQRLGRLVAGTKSVPRAELRARYESGFMEALREPATTRKHVNVLQHMAGYFTDYLDTASRQELQAVIRDFRAGMVPLVAPLILINQYVRKFDVAYLRGQVYLEPHPKELMLRNHV